MFINEIFNYNCTLKKKLTKMYVINQLMQKLGSILLNVITLHTQCII